MPLLEYNNAGISAMAAAVPAKTVKNLEYTSFFPAADVKKIVEKLGIFERRFAGVKICSSDLCYAAAKALFKDFQVNTNEIDVLLFVSQTPDYRMPATSVILQHRLGLKKSLIAFDINLGCSGFVYGLQVAYSMLSNPAIRKILLLNGETRSKVYSPKDRKTAFIFGDAGAAVLVQRDQKFGKSYFSLHSDGSGESVIKIDGGGYRNPSTAEGLKGRVVDQYGNIRHSEQGYMDGESVFNFVIREVPDDIKRLLQFSGLNKKEIDYFVFHQASKLMNDFLVKKLNLNQENVPTTLENFGNTSSVSLPLTIIHSLSDRMQNQKNLLLSAFGVGLSWASAIIKTDNCHINSLVEVEE